MEFDRDYFSEDIKPENFDTDNPKVRLIAEIWEDLRLNEFTTPEKSVREAPYEWGEYDTWVSVMSILQNKLLDTLEEDK